MTATANIQTNGNTAIQDSNNMTEEGTMNHANNNIDMASRISNVLRMGSISKLVDAAKSFSYMDQDTIQNVDVHQGLEDTVTILGERLKGGIAVVL